MVGLPPIDVPTAMAAAVLTFLANFLKEEFQRIRSEHKKEEEKIADWLDDVVALSREVQIAAMSHEANLEAFNEEIPPVDEFEDVTGLARSYDADPELLSEFEDFLNRTGASGEPVMSHMRNKRSEFKSSLFVRATEEFESYYHKLKRQWAAIPSEYDDEILREIQNHMVKTTATCLNLTDRDGIELDEYADLFEQAGELGEVAGRAKKEL